MLVETVPKEDLCLMKGFRSIIEITMWGNQEEKRYVDERGRLKFSGVTATLKHLKEVFGLEVPVKKVPYSFAPDGQNTEKAEKMRSVVVPVKFGRLENANSNSGGKNFPVYRPSHSRWSETKPRNDYKQQPPHKKGRFE
ncbi:hypothetical protein niasHT_018118 [Heterodera trifolii]|uniref:Uncharacterized protein n=1 Tax=Heterodera trifolii TaxID=157864 RepID=A0ABD2L467_9BILA